MGKCGWQETIAAQPPGNTTAPTNKLSFPSLSDKIHYRSFRYILPVHIPVHAPTHALRITDDRRKCDSHRTKRSRTVFRYPPSLTEQLRKPLREYNIPRIPKNPSAHIPCPRGSRERAMRFHLTPRPLLHLITAILLAPRPTVLANPAPAPSVQAGFSFNELFARYDCAGTYCGYSSQLCCTAGSTCYTDANAQAQCGAATTAATAAGGYWQYYTTTIVESELATITSVMSSYIGGAAATPAAATTTAACNYALNESPCGSICCASNQYCYAAGTCSPAANGGSSGYYSTYTTPGATAGVATANPGIRGTSSSNVVVTSTAAPSTTVPFESPVATGANVTLTSAQAEHTGLSGGAIAGIVIGVLVGLFLLGLLCFYCCLKGLFDGLVALFGGRRRNKRTEVDEYEHYSHHSSRHGGGRGGGGGRTWYGASKPARVTRRDERRSSNHEGRNMAGVAAGLGALWAILGLKRRQKERRNEEKYSEYSYSSDYYTSASEYPSRLKDTHEITY